MGYRPFRVAEDAPQGSTGDEPVEFDAVDKAGDDAVDEAADEPADEQDANCTEETRQDCDDVPDCILERLLDGF